MAKRIRLLDELGLVAHDVAFDAWVANVDAGEVPEPWRRFPGTTPEQALTRYPRWTTFWARWRTNASSAAPTPPRNWRGLLEIPAPSSHPTTLHGMAHELIQTGRLRPPWTRAGHLPGRAVELEDTWLRWVNATFDDHRSYARYLAPYPPPPAWRTFLEKRIRPELRIDPYR